MESTNQGVYRIITLLEWCESFMTFFGFWMLPVWLFSKWFFVDGFLLIILIFSAIDCGQLPTPEKAEKVLETHTRIDGVVKFKCREKGYEIRGSEMRSCQQNGQWSGSVTLCESKYLSLFTRPIITRWFVFCRWHASLHLLFCTGILFTPTVWTNIRASFNRVS